MLEHGVLEVLIKCCIFVCRVHDICRVRRCVPGNYRQEGNEREDTESAQGSLTLAFGSASIICRSGRSMWLYGVLCAVLAEMVDENSGSLTGRPDIFRLAFAQPPYQS